MPLLRPRKYRGSIVLLTLFIIVFLALLGTGFTALLPVEMQSAKRDRTVVQAGFGADSGLRMVLDQLYHDVAWYNIETDKPVALSSNWSYLVENIEELEPGIYRVTTAGLRNGIVRRRAVAIVDNGAGKFALRFTTYDTSGTQSINSEGAWPVNVPITGDVFLQGTWYVDDTGVDLSKENLDRPFKGLIFQTDPTGDAPRGERYVGPTPQNVSEYANLYDYGIDAVQTYDPAKVGDDLLFVSSDMNPRMIRLALGVDTDTKAKSILAKMSGSVYVGDTDKDGILEGGLYIDGDVTTRFSYDPSSGVATTVLQSATTTVTLKTRKALEDNYVTSPDQMQVTIGSGGSTATYQCDLNKGYVIYVNGEVTSVGGTYMGSQTLAAARGITITDELLKSDTPRGKEPDGSRDVLGLVACLNPGSNDPGMSIDMQSVPPDKEYFLYAHLTALSHNDRDAKMFSRSQHPALPDGTTLSLYGSMSWAPTTAGQINTSMDYISSWKQVVLDSHLPVGFPGGGKYIPRVRSYVDLPVGQ